MICCNAAWPEATQQTKEEAETAFNWEVRLFFFNISFFKGSNSGAALLLEKHYSLRVMWQARLQCLFSYFLLYVVYLVPWVLLGFYPGFVCSVSFNLCFLFCVYPVTCSLPLVFLILLTSPVKHSQTGRQHEKLFSSESLLWLRLKSHC